MDNYYAPNSMWPDTHDFKRNSTTTSDGHYVIWKKGQKPVFYGGDEKKTIGMTFAIALIAGLVLLIKTK
ncbi:MAG: hypothetical protein WB421_17705 [Terriglobales bacterium]